MLSCFLSQSAADYSMSSEKVMADVEECDRQCSMSASYKPMKERIAMLEDKLGEVHKSFLCCVSAKGESNITWKFWKEFVFRDAFAYLCLFLSIRGGLWDLRTASIKTIAPMFTAFDRPHYWKLIPPSTSKRPANTTCSYFTPLQRWSLCVQYSWVSHAFRFP